MYNFTLNNFYTGHNINEFFINTVKSHPDILKENNIRFNQIEGTIPFNIFGGTINANKAQNIVSYSVLNELFRSEAIAPRLDFSSVVLTPEDFENNYNRVFLEQADSGAPYIVISNLQLYEFIKQKYPYYTKFVLSENAWAIMDITPEILNCILEQEDFKLVTLPAFVDDDFIQQIEYKDKIEITVNPPCRHCKNYKACIIEENQSIYDFSEDSIRGQCRKYCGYAQKCDHELEDLSKYTKQGITHFRIAPTNSLELMEYLLFLVSYFIKPEYQTNVYKDFLMMTQQ